MKSFSEFKKMNINEEASPDEELWKEWRTLVNMTLKQLQDFYDSKEGKTAGVKPKDKNKIGLDMNRESAKMLLKMIPNGESFKKAEESWTTEMWEWCKKQITYIKRVRTMRKRLVGNPFERDGEKTAWYKSLLIWGHDPSKPLRKNI